MERMVLTKEDKTIRQILIDVASKGSTQAYVAELDLN